MADLKLTRIAKSYPTRSGQLEVLRDISMSLACGESLSIIGPSGSGKSTLLHILGTLVFPTAGEYFLFGEAPFSLEETARATYRNRKIGFIFQDHFLLPQLSVLENVLVPVIAHGTATKDFVARARQLLDRVGLSPRLMHRPNELSGGERQRVALARALIMAPKLILADEPTGNLDRRTAESVAEVLLALPQNENAILVIVTHSETLAGMANRCQRLLDGRLEEA